MADLAEIVTDEMSEEEFERRTLELIRKEFGLAGLARFIRTFRAGHEDYTAWHEQAEQPSLEQILDEFETYGLMQDTSRLRQALAEVQSK